MRKTIEQLRAESRKRAKDLIVAIVAAAGGKLEDKIRLHTVFWKAHQEYFQATGKNLTGYPMVHTCKGPNINQFEPLAEELYKENRLIETKSCGMHIYHTIENLKDLQTTDRATAIQTAIEWVIGRSLDELKTKSRQLSWQRTSNGQIQDIMIDSLQALASEDRRTRINRIKDAMMS